MSFLVERGIDQRQRSPRRADDFEKASRLALKTDRIPFLRAKSGAIARRDGNVPSSKFVAKTCCARADRVINRGRDDAAAQVSLKRDVEPARQSAQIALEFFPSPRPSRPDRAFPHISLFIKRVEEMFE